jgi:hypothetical protein
VLRKSPGFDIREGENDETTHLVPQRGGYEKKGLKPAALVRVFRQGCAGFLFPKHGQDQTIDS